MFSSDGTYGTGTRSHTRGQALAIGSLVCGILGLFLFSLILGPLAILAGYLARRQVTGNGVGIAKAGIALGIADLTLVAILLAAAA
ncbi:DUF4190 domain-containing protein [Streptomyces sp. NPDC020965]|uniref:DUF4190 domain-containing protein n=1 Tax=Streptomyces sp. NPDC020965 TaxID=3365105 RepID=UPI00379D5578